MKVELKITENPARFGNNYVVVILDGNQSMVHELLDWIDDAIGENVWEKV